MQTLHVAPAIDRAPATAAGPQPGKYLIFHLGSEQFGMQVLKVREIVSAQTVTSIPQTPDYIRGVIDLRGKVIPVVDLRVKCGLPESQSTQRTCIVVVQVHSGTNAVQMGILVDGVAEVLNLGGGDIEATCDFGPGVRVPDVLGLAKIEDRVTVLLDVDQVLSNQQLRSLRSVVQ